MVELVPSACQQVTRRPGVIAQLLAFCVNKHAVLYFIQLHICLFLLTTLPFFPLLLLLILFFVTFRKHRLYTSLHVLYCFLFLVGLTSPLCPLLAATMRRSFGSRGRRGLRVLTSCSSEYSRWNLCGTLVWFYPSSNQCALSTPPYKSHPWFTVSK